VAATSSGDRRFPGGGGTGGGGAVSAESGRREAGPEEAKADRAGGRLWGRAIG
jgi:hypothetical protein